MSEKVKRYFSPEQKYEMIKDIETYETIKEGLEKYDLQYSVFRRWRRQLEVGVSSSLRNGRPVKTSEEKRLSAENRRLKQIILEQSAVIADIKKEMSLD